MDDRLTKFCVCGMTAIVIYGSTPLCKNCLDLRLPDMPSQGSFSYDFQQIQSSYISDTSGSASIHPFTGFLE